MSELHPQSNPETIQPHPFGYVRIVSQVEAKRVLEDKLPFIRPEVFEVWDRKLPPVVYTFLNTKGRDPSEDPYEGVLFLPVEYVDSYYGIPSKDNRHLGYEPDFPATFIQDLNLKMNTNLAENVVDITESVILKIREANINPSEITNEQAKQLSLEPIFDNDGNIQA